VNSAAQPLRTPGIARLLHPGWHTLRDLLQVDVVEPKSSATVTHLAYCHERKAATGVPSSIFGNCGESLHFEDLDRVGGFASA
jgi:hypothetical protein